MIAFDFAYARPDTLGEAVELFVQAEAQGKSPVYYAGGSEIISMCRTGSIRPGLVIDIKAIPECNRLSLDGQGLYIGAAITLSQISQSRLYPLLSLAGGRIADHTNQCRITLGGNLCGTIMYREASLPLLLSDADITLHGPKGQRTLPISSAFVGRMRLSPGEMVVQVRVPAWALAARHFHIKKATREKIDYPLVSVAALLKGQELRIGLSGICTFPFRSKELENMLGDRRKSREERASLAASLLPEPAQTTAEGTGAYRVFLLKNTLLELLEAVEDGAL